MRRSAATWGPWCAVGLAVGLVAVQIPTAFRVPALDLWTNMGVGWAWRTFPDLNVYNPPALRELLYSSEVYGEFRQISAWGLPFNSFISTPFMLFIYAPLSLLSLEAARLLWFALGVLLYSWVAGWIARELWRDHHPWVGGAFAVYAACFVPPYLDWGGGNTNALLLLCAWGIGIAVERKRDLFAGGLITIVTLIKLYPGLLFAYMLYARSWRVVAGAAAAGVVLGAACVWAVGFQPAMDYFTVILPTIGGGNTSGHNQGFTGFWLHWQFPELLGELKPPSIGRPHALTLVSLLFLAAAAWRARRPFRREGFLFSPEYGLVWTTMFLLSPSVWEHYFTLMLLPLGGRWLAAVRSPTPLRLVATVLVSAGIGLLPEVGAGPGIHVRPVALLVLWAMCVYDAGRPQLGESIPQAAAA